MPDRLVIIPEDLVTAVSAAMDELSDAAPGALQKLWRRVQDAPPAPEDRTAARLAADGFLAAMAARPGLSTLELAAVRRVRSMLDGWEDPMAGYSGTI